MGHHRIARRLRAADAQRHRPRPWPHPHPRLHPERRGLAENVTVAASPALLQTDTAEISDVIDNREVVQLPLNGRNFLALAQLSDAVVIPPGGTRGDALQQAGPLPNVGGQRSGHNIYLLDGAKVTDELFNNLVINPSVDSIQEFKIQKSMYPAEFGGKASALINVATKAGGNAFHGSLFEFHRNDVFDAHNYFDADRPAGAAAAPEPVRRRARRSARAGPHLLLRQLRRAAHAPIADAHLLGAVRRGPRRQLRRARADLRSADDRADRRAARRLPNNQIPADRIDPIAAAFLQHVPLPTVDAARSRI